MGFRRGCYTTATRCEQPVKGHLDLSPHGTSCNPRPIFILILLVFTFCYFLAERVGFRRGCYTTATRCEQPVKGHLDLSPHGTSCNPRPIFILILLVFTFVVFLAERVGFEPTVRVGTRTHDFESCTFDLSDISPDFIVIYHLNIILNL